MLCRLQNPSTPSTEEVWQCLRAARSELPQRQERWHQAYLMSQEPPAQVKQHKLSSHDIKLDLAVVHSYETDIVLEH